MIGRNCWFGAVFLVLVCAAGRAGADGPELSLPPALPQIPEAAIFAGSANPALRYCKLGLLALENGDPARAADFFRYALQEDGGEADRPKFRDLRQESLLESGALAEAGKVLDEAAAAPDMQSEKALLTVMRARQCFFAGQKNEARTLLEDLLRSDADCGAAARVRALELLAQVRNALGDYEGADRSCGQLADLTAADPFRHWRALSAAVLNALDAGRHDRAAELLERMDGELPDSFRQRHHGQITRLRLLSEARSDNTAQIEPQYDALLATARAPDALLGRLAGVLARFHAERADWPRAAELWTAALNFGDEWFRAPALLGLMESEAAAGAPEKALKTLERYQSLYPTAENRFRRMLFEASLWQKLNQPEEAEKLYRQVYQESEEAGERREAALELARGAWRTARSDEAVEMLKFAAAQTEDPAMKRRLRQRLGECLYRMGRFQEAEAVFAEVAQGGDGGERDAALLWRAQSLYQLKEFEQAFRLCAAIRSSGTVAVRRGGAYLRALLLERLGRSEEAVAAYLEFADRYPGSGEAATALFQAGVLAQLTPKYDAAELFRRCAEQYPGESAANALYKAHGELLASGRTREAAAVLGDLEKLYPTSRYTVGAHFAHVDALRESGKAAAALAALDEIERRYGKDNPLLQSEIAFDRAVLGEQSGDSAAAVKALTRIAEQYADQPIAPQALFMLGDIRARNNDFEAAMALFRQAGERRPGGDFAAGCAGRAADAAFGLYALSRQEKYLKEAQNGYENLLKQPDLAPLLRFQSMYKLGHCLAAAGDAAGAVKWYGAVLYEAVSARREGRFFAPVWSARAFHSAMEILDAEARQADAASGDECRWEALRLLALARELELPGENLEAWQERWAHGVR